ncbi:MAG: DNA mismatch repair protein MutS [Myxococcota bacterium]
MSEAPKASRARETPMMRQYLGVKAAHPDAIVLFRMGDFFEAFFEDAEACAQLLDITLTARSKERDVPMAGVPQHAIDGYLSRLVAQGRRVVLVDQVEDPRSAKGLVRREVTRILTPGTYVDPLAAPRSFRHLAAVVEGRSGFGVSILEASTGSFRATDIDSVEDLEEELSRLEVAEVLVVEGARWTWTHGPTSPQSPREQVEAESLLETHLGRDEFEGLKALISQEALKAAGLALGYVKRTQLIASAQDLTGTATLGHVSALVPYAAGAGLVLDTQTRDHLELFAAHGDGGCSFFACIDETRSGPGARLLAQWLGAPLSDISAIRRRSGAVESLVNQPSRLDAIRSALQQLPDLERLVGRLAMGRALPPDLRALAAGLLQVPAILQALEAVAHTELGSEGRLAELAHADRCGDIANRLDTALDPKPPRDPTDPGVFVAGYDTELDRLHALSFDSKQLIARLETEERSETKIPSLKVRYNKVFGYYIEVTKSNLHLVPDRFIRKQTTVNTERFFTAELKSLEQQVATAEEERQRRSAMLFTGLVQEVSGQVRRLRELASIMAEVDVLSCFATLAERRSWQRPELVSDPVLLIEQGRHPVLEQRADVLQERFVPNDLVLDDAERLLIITGPNMAGKSTVMRQTALIAILSHMGSFVPADRAVIGRLDRIFTRVGAGDELSKGRSTFMVEMSETAKILRSATSRSLVLLDEIGRGTSTFDGLAIAWAVAEDLHDRVHALTLFATHYHELTEIGRTHERAGNRHIMVREVRDRIVFLRKLAEGGANRSYGVQVARLAGLPSAVVARARELLTSLERGERLGAGGPQLDLFAPPEDRSTVVLDRLRSLDVDELSPRGALDLVAELKSWLEAETDAPG